jgi:peroxiredoxin
MDQVKGAEMGGKLMTGITAPDFELSDTNDQKVRLSDFCGRQNIVLVFNRGFA